MQPALLDRFRHCLQGSCRHTVVRSGRNEPDSTEKRHKKRHNKPSNGQANPIWTPSGRRISNKLVVACSWNMVVCRGARKPIPLAASYQPLEGMRDQCADAICMQPALAHLLDAACTTVTSGRHACRISWFLSQHRCQGIAARLRLTSTFHQQAVMPASRA